MQNKDARLADNITKIIHDSVTTTIATIFNVSIDSCANTHKVSFNDDYICCGELIQDDARAKLMFVFDRDLIERLMQCVFSASELADPNIYESAALEIVNIVGNNLKTYLNIHGYKLHMALPYIPDCSVPGRGKIAAEDPLVRLAFSLKEDGVMGVDFYLNRA